MLLKLPELSYYVTRVKGHYVNEMDPDLMHAAIATPESPSARIPPSPLEPKLLSP